MLNLLFNTLLTITPHNTQKRRRRKERTTYGPLRRYSRLVTHPVLNRPTGLNLSAVTKPSFARIIARYVFLVIIVICMVYKRTNRLHVVERQFSNRSEMTSKCVLYGFIDLYRVGLFFAFVVNSTCYIFFSTPLLAQS